MATSWATRFIVCLSVLCLRCFTDSRRRSSTQTGSWRGLVRPCLCMPPSRPWPSPAAWCRPAPPPNQPAPLWPAQHLPLPITPTPTAPRSTTTHPRHTTVPPALSLSAPPALHAHLWPSLNLICPPVLHPSRWSLLPVCKRGEKPDAFQRSWTLSSHPGLDFLSKLKKIFFLNCSIKTLQDWIFLNFVFVYWFTFSTVGALHSYSHVGV